MKKNLWLLIGLGVISAVVAYFYYTRSSKTYADSFADFSIADTASIDKVIIADTDGNKVTLKRGEGKWILNDSLEARPEAINLVLTAIKDVIVQSPVANSARDYTIKRLSATHRMVQIFQNGNSEPTKIWYVGDPTQSHMGTTVLLEIPGEGKAPDPYILEIPYHHGFLTPIFFTDAKEWMQTPMFVYPQLEFEQIKVTDFRQPENSFVIEKTGNSFSVKDPMTNNFLPSLDSLLLKDYLDKYKGIYYEVGGKYLTANQTDSMLHSQPLYQIAVKDANGKINEIEIFKKQVVVRPGEMIPNDDTDPYRYYGWINKQKVVIIQRYVFDNLLLRKTDFAR